MSSSEIQILLIFSGIVFLIAFFGNLLSFGSRFVNAFVTALIAAAVGVGFVYASGGGMPAVTEPSFLQALAVAAGAVFIADLIANMLSFSNRFVSAIVTALVFAGLYAAVLYGVL
ncbi:MAG: hypothetical protein NW215_07920 [Hyphomicrobiales bacterium]|nr:hypothetical protein [Hyphomicrobiales bacterium]